MRAWRFVRPRWFMRSSDIGWLVGACGLRRSRHVGLRFARWLVGPRQIRRLVRACGFPGGSRAHRLGADLGRFRLTLLKGSAGRCRIAGGDNLTVFDGGRRMGASRGSGSQDAGASGLHVYLVRDGSRLEFVRVHLGEVTAHGTRVDERLARDGGHCSGDALVHVSNAVDVVVDDVVVVDVGDLRDIHTRIGDVDVVQVDAADTVGWNVDFTRAEREPGDASADSEGEIDATAADKRDERRSVDGANDYRTGKPAPAVFHESPASVVEGREAPRFIFYPGPSPGFNPDPVAVAIGGPPAGNRSRGPDRAVVGDVVPATIVIEVLVPGHLARDVVGGFGSIFAIIALGAPLVEVVAARNLHDLVFELVGTAEGGALAGHDGVGVSTARSLSVALPDSSESLCSI